MRTLGCLVGLGIVAVVSGCQSGEEPDVQAPSTGQVAVVDLDEVARQTGRDKEIDESLQTKKKELDRQLAELQSSLRVQYQKKKDEFGPSPTKDQQRKLQEMDLQVGLQLQQSQRKAQRQMDTHRAKLIRQFRDEMKPIVRQVASDNGWSVVIPKDDNLLLSVEPEAEITDQVIDRMRSTGAGPAPVPTRSAKAPATSGSTTR